MKFETIEQLVKERRGYKILLEDNRSPYQNYKYTLKKGEILKTKLDGDRGERSGAGWNLATLDWCFTQFNCLDKKIVEFSIPEKATIIIPHNTDGKFRTNIIEYTKTHNIYELLPSLKNWLQKLKKYKPINPIQTTKMPSVAKISVILCQVWNQVCDQVWNQVWNQVSNQVSDQVWNQVSDQVWNQVRIISYFAVKEFFSFPYEHPIFDLIRLGIIAVKTLEGFSIFGKNGILLGMIKN